MIRRYYAGTAISGGWSVYYIDEYGAYVTVAYRNTREEAERLAGEMNHE